MSPRFDVRTILHYYITLTAVPVSPTYNSNLPYIPEQNSLVKLFKKNPKRTSIYIFSRCLYIIYTFTVVRLIICILWELHLSSNLNTFELLGLIMSLGLVLIPFYTGDKPLLNAWHHLLQSLDTCDKIWEKVKVNLPQNETAQLKFNKSFKTGRIMLHNVILDYMSIINFAWSTFQFTDAESDPLYMRSLIPWNTPFVNGIYWFVQQFIGFTATAGWSFMLTFPGALAYHYECVINTLTKSMEVAGPTSALKMEAILADFEHVEYAMRELRRKGFADVLLIFNLATGFQQAIQSFCIFQMIKAGAPWEDYQFSLQDLMFTGSRFFHLLYALSRVDLASQSFFDVVRARIRENEDHKRTLFAKRRLMRKILLTKPVLMHIGPWACTKDLPVLGGSAFLNNVIATALWP